MWYKFVDKAWKVKTHYVNEILKDALIQYLCENHGAVLDLEHCETSNKTFFEPGGYGMRFIHQPRFTLNCGEKLLEVDVFKAQELLFDLQSAERKAFDAMTEGHVLYSRFNCLVLSPADREETMFQLQGRMPALVEEGNAWHEETERLWQENKQAYEAEHGEGSFPIVRIQDLQSNQDKKPN